ncbi:MAG: 50S ribosomal protein L23 [Alphaproteobacteria bacterium]|nr:50S ribosomal protein L23 [Alphaproteobacteria bacterium]
MALSIYDVLKKPHVTEDAMRLASDGVFTFVVSESADKNVIAKAVEKIFNVEVESVRIARKPAKRKVFRGQRGLQNKLKKALVRLKKGQTIEGWS